MSENPKIVICSTDAAVMSELEALFRRHACCAIGVTTPTDLPRVATDSEADVILADLRPGQLSVSEAIRRLRRDCNTSGLPVIALVAPGLGVEAKIEAFAIGADDAVPYPFRFEEMKPRIQAALRKAELYRELEETTRAIADSHKALEELLRQEKDQKQALIKQLRGSGDRQYDVSISFASPERPLAERLAQMLRDAGFEVFYDDFYPEQLWGQDLVELFDRVFRTGSRYCVIFISKEYLERLWTNHERRSAQARALAEVGKEYILPIQVDASELPGLSPTIGYLSLKKYSIQQIGTILLRKLFGRIPVGADTGRLLDLLSVGVVTLASLASGDPLPYVRCPKCSGDGLEECGISTEEATVLAVRCPQCGWKVTDHDLPVWETRAGDA